MLFVSFVILVHRMTSVAAATTVARGKLPRLVAFDLDGTYLTSSCIHISPFTVYIIKTPPLPHSKSLQRRPGGGGKKVKEEEDGASAHKQKRFSRSQKMN